MSDLGRDEEEQVAALRNWWKENGTSIIVGITVALLAIFGWRYWQQYQADTTAAASQRFQELLAAESALPAAPSDESAVESTASIAFFADELISSAEGTAYAVFAHLMRARLAFEQARYPDAEQDLRAALEKLQDPAMRPAIEARLARVLSVLERQDEALALLQVDDTAPHAAYFRELAGDILLAKGQREQAREQYERALTLSLASGIDTALLQAKVDDLADV